MVQNGVVEVGLAGCQNSGPVPGNHSLYLYVHTHTYTYIYRCYLLSQRIHVAALHILGLYSSSYVLTCGDMCMYYICGWTPLGLGPEVGDPEGYSMNWIPTSKAY